MSNILKITTPAVGYDNANQAKNSISRQVDPSIQGAIRPDKVLKPDARSDAASQEENVAMKFRYDSNYENFLQKVSQLPNMSEEFAKLFFERFATIAESGMGDEFAEKIARFFEMIGMSEEELAGFMKGQSSAAVRFSGVFFELLNQVMQQSKSVELRASILDFLKKYTDMSESRHMMKNVENLLDKIAKNLFKNESAMLKEMMSNLNFSIGASGEGLEQTVFQIKESIIPFLNKNIMQLHDRGQLRELTSMLSNYIARCENGLPNRVLEAFENLLRYQGMQKVFQNFDPAVLFQVLQNTDYEKSVKKQKWMDGLVELIESGVSGKAGPENKSVFRNLMQAILLNESVYMPILHMMLPMQINGKLMFAEMWIDPDAEKDKTMEDSRERTIQGLIKFDVQDLGFFDMYFIYQGGNIKMQLGCPQSLEGEMSQIKKDIAGIFSANTIQTEELFVDVDNRSIPISAAFNKIFERKNSINVSI